MAEFTGIPRIDRLLADAEETPNPTGNPTRKIFFHADRYLFDFNINVGEWEQFDSENDAWYFGVWVNRTRLRILQYVEGDVYFTQCADAEGYDAEIAALCAFHEAAPSMVVIDDGGKATAYYQNRRDLFIDPARATVPAIPEPASNPEGE